jgi:Family of unknown function (DUF6111)
MLRLLELALFLSPFAALAIWRLSLPRGGPSLSVVVGCAVAVLLLAVGLIWFERERRMGPGTIYQPARLENGRIVPGHAATAP